MWCCHVCCRQEVLTLEKPVDTAMLLSLAGINVVCSNQWHCTLQENAHKIDIAMKGLLLLLHVLRH